MTRHLHDAGVLTGLLLLAYISGALGAALAMHL
jgi:hypothetical protein